MSPWIIAIVMAVPLICATILAQKGAKDVAYAVLLVGGALSVVVFVVGIREVRENELLVKFGIGAAGALFGAACTYIGVKKP